MQNNTVNLLIAAEATIDWI